MNTPASRSRLRLEFEPVHDPSQGGSAVHAEHAGPPPKFLVGRALLRRFCVPLRVRVDQSGPGQPLDKFNGLAQHA